MSQGRFTGIEVKNNVYQQLPVIGKGFLSKSIWGRSSSVDATPSTLSHLTNPIMSQK